MTSTPRRDDVVERLLRRVSTATADAGAELCPEAEVLAAWVDQELPHALRETVDLHVAGCERCQLIAATMAKMTSAEEAAPVASPARWLRWLVPVAAAAAVLLFWLIAPGWFPVSRPLKTGEQAQAGNAVAPAPPPAPSADAASRAAEARAPATTMEDKKAASGEVAARPEAAPVRPGVLATPPPPAATPPPPPPQAQASAAAQALDKTAPAMREVAENRPRAADALPAGREFQTPDGSVRWRLRAGVPERSTDAGVTWTSLPTGIDATLLAGAAPDSATCWLAGQGGVVLRRTGTGPWTRVGFPEAVDLASIRATDAAHASVTTADGRVFETADGGDTWVRRELQGNPAPAF